MGNFTLAEEISENPIVGFIGFVLLLAGFLLLVSGLVIFITNKKEWEMYYNLRDQKELPDVAKRIRDRKKSIALMIIGGICVLVSLFMN